MQPDHLIGHKVEKIEGPGNEGYWTIRFEGGDDIACLSRIAKPKDIEGKILTSVDENENGFQFNFGEVQVALGKNQLVINGEDPWNDDAVELPPDPSADRIHPGPTDEEVREELERASQSQEVEEAAGETE